MEHEYELVLAFDSDDPEFTRGFEAGAIWEQMKGRTDFNCIIHANNAEMVMRMAKAKGYSFHGEEMNEEFTLMGFKFNGREEK
ncbi:MAG: hypothetical protein ABW007_06935 [Chitinophagaceae bacterium]